MLDLPEIYAEKLHIWLPEMLYYSLTTLRITAGAFALAVLIGLVFALMRTSRLRPLRVSARENDPCSSSGQTPGESRADAAATADDGINGRPCLHGKNIDTLYT